MELWIRSQDRLLLANVKNFYIVDSDSEERVVICGYTSDDFNDFDLGSYNTKERALEVLDEIQHKINLINLGHDFGSPMIDLNNPTYIYEMPKE